MRVQQLGGQFKARGETLWRSTSLWVLLLQLEKGLHFTNLGEMEDRYESRLRPQAGAHWTAGWIGGRGRQLRERAEAHEGVVRTRLLDLLNAVDIERLAQQCRSTTAVSCWSQYDRESVDLWNRVGAQVAVRADRSRLLEALEAADEYAWHRARASLPAAGAIRYYDDDEPADSPLFAEIAGQTLPFVKASFWDSEREFRVSVFSRDAHIDLPVPAEDYVDEIVLSPRLPPSEAEAYRWALSRAAPQLEPQIRRSAMFGD